MIGQYIVEQPFSTWIAFAALMLSVISLRRTARSHRTAVRQTEAEKKTLIYYQLTQTRLVLDGLAALVQRTLGDVMQFAPEQCDILNQRPDNDDYFKELSRFESRIVSEVESNMSLYEKVLTEPGKLTPDKLELHLGYAKETHLKIADWQRQAETRCHEILKEVEKRKPTWGIA